MPTTKAALFAADMFEVGMHEQDVPIILACMFAVRGIMFVLGLTWMRL
jgi:hypothetical protein